MSITLIHPDKVHHVDVHHQVAVASGGGRTVYLAGQVSWDVQGNLVGRDDLAAQAEQCYLNIAAALEAVGATVADLAKVTVYVVDLDEAKAEQFVVGRERAAAALGAELQQPSTWVGVTALAAPGTSSRSTRWPCSPEALPRLGGAGHHRSDLPGSATSSTSVGRPRR